MKLLLVEDDASHAKELVANIHEILGHEIQILGPFNRYKSAMKCIENDKFDIAVLDIQLQDDRYAGVHLAEYIESLHHTPILFVTGVADTQVIAQTKTIKNCDFIAKPFDINTLKRALLRSIEKKRFETNAMTTDKVSHRAGNRDKYWIRGKEGNYIGVPINDIVFVEAQNKVCEFHLRDGTVLEKRATLEKDIYAGTLAFYTNFYKLGKSYIVNLDHVSNIEGKQIIYPELDKKKVIIPSTHAKAFFDTIGLKK